MCESVLRPESTYVMVTIEVPDNANVDRVEAATIASVKNLRQLIGSQIGIMNVSCDGSVDWL